MKFFAVELVEKALEQTLAFIKLQYDKNVMTLTLNRPAKKNALHPHMVQEIAFGLQFAHQNKDVRAVVIDAVGDVFCAGADLKAFMGMVGEFESTVPVSEEEILLGELFGKVHKPIIVKVEGNVFAGGFFFLTGSNYVICKEGIRLGLPEVKRGLYPFQVMASLLEVMPKRKVVDWCIRGYDLEVQSAKEYGLVTEVVPSEKVNDQVNGILETIIKNSPTAIRLGLEALETIQHQPSKHQYLMEMLQKAVASKDGQEGLLAFRQKRPPVWTGE